MPGEIPVGIPGDIPKKPEGISEDIPGKISKRKLKEVLGKIPDEI